MRRIPSVRCTLCWADADLQDTQPKNRTTLLTDLILHAPQIFTSPTLFWKLRLTWKNAEAENLPKPLLKTDFIKKWLCQKKRTWQKNPNQTCRNFCEKPWCQFWRLDFVKNNLCYKNITSQNETACLPKLWLKILKPIWETWANLTRNFLKQKHEPIFKPTKFWK